MLDHTLGENIQPALPAKYSKQQQALQDSVFTLTLVQICKPTCVYGNADEGKSVVTCMPLVC